MRAVRYHRHGGPAADLAPDTDVHVLDPGQPLTV